MGKTLFRLGSVVRQGLVLSSTSHSVISELINFSNASIPFSQHPPLSVSRLLINA